MRQAIEHNSAEIRRLHQAIHDTWSHRAESPQAFAAWEAACSVFHSRYNALALPGGLTSAMERLATGDMQTAETAIIFLEVHPYFFRSQYIATTLTRRLKKLRLPAHLQQRFEDVRAAERQRKLRKTGKG